MNGEAAQVYRVTVRGRFGALSDEARRYLVGAQGEHDILVSAYTPEGTFTYDARIDFFNLRYEVRVGGADPHTVASNQALGEAATFLRTMGFTHRDLKVTVVDMSAIMAELDRRPRSAQRRG
ncbi:unannotated protein [freshwater metagenome]|uniref:Unannotated protein n=1 Tax=freshwater metagenome TaxID=449393 RepID=A0A6J7ESG3_9ZZZZ|nr:hypothetical protein [Actinomycetota bacterium]